MSSDSNVIPIPNPEINNFQQLALTDSQLIVKVKNELQIHEPITHSLDDLAKKIAEENSMNFNEVSSVISTIANWILVQRRMDLTSEEFMEGVTAFLESQSESIWSSDHRQAWRDRYDIILDILSSNNAVSLGAKAIELFFEHQLVLCSTRIITDLRPIFNDEATELIGFFSYHTLVARCVEGSQLREFHVALDKNDLTILKEQLERASKKASLLEKDLTDNNFKIIDTNIISEI